MSDHGLGPLLVQIPDPVFQYNGTNYGGPAMVDAIGDCSLALLASTGRVQWFEYQSKFGYAWVGELRACVQLAYIDLPLPRTIDACN
jgi:hypothetical protein